LLPESIAELEKIVTILRENPTLKVQISGHTDNVGKDADNLVLSASRAKAVVEYIITKRIPAARLTHKGFGAAQPVADNATRTRQILEQKNRNDGHFKQLMFSPSPEVLIHFHLG